jgi:putative sterol carrier protein
VSEQPDPGTVSAEEFARLIAAWEDDGIIEEGLRAVGVERVLDRVFDQMAERFRPDRAGDREGMVQWRIHVRDEEHAYVLRIEGGSCTAGRGAAEDPRVTFLADLAAFARLITGQADPVRLVLKGRLRVSGDLLFARHVPTFFEMPRG